MIDGALQRVRFLSKLKRAQSCRRRRSKWIRARLLRPDGTPMNRREQRMARIAESQRQGVEIAKQARIAYVQRRTDRWRGLVETNMPRMFNDALREAGIVS